MSNDTIDRRADVEGWLRDASRKSPSMGNDRALCDARVLSLPPTI